jgi:hypothetical protein
VTPLRVVEITFEDIYEETKETKAKKREEKA